jgi:hypothetical protein
MPNDTATIKFIDKPSGFGGYCIVRMEVCFLTSVITYLPFSKCIKFMQSQR